MTKKEMDDMLNANVRLEKFFYKDSDSIYVWIDTQGNPWFCLNNICDILHIKKLHILLERIDIKYKFTLTVQNLPMKFVSEAGLYQAIGRSRKSKSYDLLVWIFGELIPKIREMA